MGYADWFSKLLPTSLRRAVFGKYSQALGESLDASDDGGFIGQGMLGPDWGVTPRLKFAVKARFPDNPLGATATPDDALDQTGGERLLERGPGETSAAWGTRLRLAWDAWVYGGTPLGLLTQLKIAGYTNVAIGIGLGHWYTLDGTGALVDVSFPAPFKAVEGDPARRYWNQFVLLFFAPLPVSWQTGGPPAANSDEVAKIKRILNRWRPAVARCWRIAVQVSGGCWGYPVTQLWGDGSTWDSGYGGWGGGGWGGGGWGGGLGAPVDVLVTNWI